jgi:hypothetical protein
LLNPCGAAVFGLTLFRPGRAEQFGLVDAAEPLLNFLPLVAGCALVDARHVPARIDHGETFPQLAALVADYLGEGMRPVRGVGFLAADVNEDQSLVLNALFEPTFARFPWFSGPGSFL